MASDGSLLHSADLNSALYTEHLSLLSFSSTSINYMKIITAVTSNEPLDEPCLSRFEYDFGFERKEMEILKFLEDRGFLAFLIIRWLMLIFGKRIYLIWIFFSFKSFDNFFNLY